MEILQISDLHLRGDGKLSFRKVDTPACLRTAAAYLHALNRMPDAIVITGDLADSGDEHAYHMLYEALGDLPVPIYAVPGNHDRRDRMRAILKGWVPEESPVPPRVCHCVDMGEVRLVMLDSMEPGSHSGHCPEAMARWLDACLQEDSSRPALVFMHHPPFITGMGAMDEPFEGADLLRDVLSRAPWARLCCGHMHRPIFTAWAQGLALTVPSISMQIDLDLSPQGGDTFRMEMPGYMLHHWDGSHLNSHVCQIPADVDFSGPHPFADSGNPVGDGYPDGRLRPAVFFFLHVHTAPSAQLRRRASPSTGASPPDAPFFVRLSTPARTEKGAQTGQARQKRKTRTRSVNAPLSCPCLSHRAGPSPAVAPYFPENAPAGPSLSGFWQPVPRPLRPRPSGLRPLSPRAKISFCPCPAAGTGAPARPRASASTVPAGDAVQTLPRIIP